MSAGDLQSAVRTQAFAREGWTRFRDAFRGAPVFSLSVLFVLFFVGAFAPFLTPYDPNAVQLMKAHLPPAFVGGSWDTF